MFYNDIIKLPLIVFVALSIDRVLVSSDKSLSFFFGNDKCFHVAQLFTFGLRNV
jgi:hypothetical protein